MKRYLSLEIQSESVVEQSNLWIPSLYNFVHSSPMHQYQDVPYIEDNKRNADRPSPPIKLKEIPRNPIQVAKNRTRTIRENERNQQLAYTMCNQTPCGTHPTLPTPQDPPKCIYHKTCVGSCVNYQTKEVTHCIEPKNKNSTIKNTTIQCIFYFLNIQNPVTQC